MTCKVITSVCFFVTITFLQNLTALGQVNIGFENGTLDNWEFAVGKIGIDGKITTFPSIAVPGSFTLIKNDQLDNKDPFGKFSVISPNGSQYSLKLGNTLHENTVQQISYSLSVPPSGTNSIVFDYAVVLVNPGHEPPQQPRFTVKVYNITDNKYLDCSGFDFISSSDLPGFKLTDDSVYYKDWSSATINLTGLNNKKIRLEFTVNHCSFGQHFGYAYIDVNENISAPISGNYQCNNQSAITLAAPSGFEDYSWFTADFSKALGTGQYLTFIPPADLHNIAVLVTPYNGLGCTDTLYSTINNVNSDFKFTVKDIIACPGSFADLTQREETSGSSIDLTFDYLTDLFQILPSPNHITKDGLYYIRGTNAAGCTDVLPVKVTFELPQLLIEKPLPVTYPSTVDLSKTFEVQQGLTYSYYQDKNAAIPLTNYTDVKTSGTYYIKAETKFGCESIQPVVIVILPPEPFSVLAPNAFTPNNDGINDYFQIALKGQVSFTSMRIYDRNGSQIFKTLNITQAWDGNYKSRPLPTGTYYWVLEGYDKFYNQKIYKASFITLIR